MENFTICGLDEAGRGALAGPLIAAGVIINPKQEKILCNSKLPIRDSKTLSRWQRLQVFDAIKQIKIRFQVINILPKFINTCGIQKANIEAFIKLINLMDADTYIVDGILPISRYCNKQVYCKPHADGEFLPVILAGIIAKVHRDRYMIDIASKHPGFSWETNVGYGTVKHLIAIKKFGLTSHHRLVFVNTALKKYSQIY
jgi:ribonuclease HII